ncbi:MAG: hypothetical protein WC077_00795 [Bacteroidales bacterium]
MSYNLLNLPQTVNQAGMQMATYYNTTDHLASIRVITDQAGTVAEQNDYYPSGKGQTRVNNTCSCPQTGTSSTERNCRQ